MVAPFSRRIEVSPRRWLLLPIETKARELDGKALLAFEAAERGWGVIVGQENLRGLAQLPRGMVIEKGIQFTQKNKVQASIDRGRRISAWCEEGLVYYDAEDYRYRKVSLDIFSRLDHYFAWGRNQAEDMIAITRCDKKNITTSGHPRFDLHRPELRQIFSPRVDRIRRSHAPFILINSNFGVANSYRWTSFESACTERMKLTSDLRPNREQYVRDLIRFLTEVYKYFMAMVEALCQEYPNCNIVIRPHPSENHDPWLSLAARFPNLRVIYDGNVAEWILASELMIHNNCTTGVEAFMLGKCPIAYRPISSDKHDLFLPMALSQQVSTLEELFEEVKKRLDGRCSGVIPEMAAKSKILEHYVANAGELSACTTILNRLEPADMPEEELSIRVNAFAEVELKMRRELRKLRGIPFTEEELLKERYSAQKFPRTRRSELLEFLLSARVATGRFANVKVEEIARDAFCIYQ